MLTSGSGVYLVSNRASQRGATCYLAVMLDGVAVEAEEALVVDRLHDLGDVHLLRAGLAVAAPRAGDGDLAVIRLADAVEALAVEIERPV